MPPSQGGEASSILVPRSDQQLSTETYRNYINMLTEEQEKWTAHLSDKNKISIIPFDPTAEEKFQKIRQRVQEALGTQIPVEHRGATSLGISGQDEIDVYVPVPPSQFYQLIELLKSIFGEPGSLYPLERARFKTQEGGKRVDVFLINEECDGWINGLKFEKYLRANPETLDQYRKLKENGNGLSVREYYRRKTEFFNGVLVKGDSPSNLNS